VTSLHVIVATGSTEDKDRDSIRQRFKCTAPGCDLDGVVTIKPASAASGFLADMNVQHQARYPQ
jgi:hypothetical protein